MTVLAFGMSEQAALPLAFVFGLATVLHALARQSRRIEKSGSPYCTG